MTERDHIFTRIREALSVKAHAHHGQGLPSTTEHRRVMPLVGISADEQLALFARNAADLKATFKLVRDEQHLAVELKALSDSGNWQRVATHTGSIATAQAHSLGLPVMVVNEHFDKWELEKCDAGISECDALIAQTGSVLMTSKSGGGRALSCLPPHHVIIARLSQLIPDLPAAFTLIQQKYGSQYPSMVSFITGPSRTGDIERILVLGAHGPKQLNIFCIQD